MFNWFKKKQKPEKIQQPQAYNGQRVITPYEFSIYDGSKFPGGFGLTQLQYTDYWTLRERSKQLFTENLYAYGLIKRLITNEINTGLTPDSLPYNEILDISEESANEWSEDVESRWSIWAKSPLVCDFYKQDTFGMIQIRARMEALIAGDVLVVMRINPQTGAPNIQIISGESVKSPLTTTKIAKGNKIEYGVELDSQKRQVAYWITQTNGESKRLPAFGEKSGRRIAWLVYGVERKIGKVRGMPILNLVLQSMKDLDRYRDSTIRKSVLNSILAGFIKKTQDKMGTLPITNSAIRKGEIAADNLDGTPRSINFNTQTPGVYFEELQTGEEPVLLGGQGTDVNFGEFEEAIVQAMAWANELPPEILRLSFSNNYSASQAAINEAKIYLNKFWGQWGDNFCSPIYKEWLISEVLQRKIEAPKLIESWRNKNQFDILGAWLSVDWYGSIKPSTDPKKQVAASAALIEAGLSTHSRESRINTGTKFTRNIKRLKRENQMLVDAQAPLMEIDNSVANSE